MMYKLLSVRTVALAAVLLAAGAQEGSAQKRRKSAVRRPAAPQELHGSKGSVEKMYSFAVANRMPFYLTPTNIDTAIARGRLFPLTGNASYELTRGVGFAYATREARDFVLAFAPQYAASCGTPLVVTSAARPKSRQPRNANPHSVHPAGIAVDIRRPPPGPCLKWVRSALTELEKRNIVEATEERHPVHIHLAVLVPPAGRVTLPNLATPLPTPRVSSTSIPRPVTFQTSAGDVSAHR